MVAAAFAATVVALLLLRIGSDLFRWRTKQSPSLAAERVALVLGVAALVIAVLGSTDQLLKVKLRQHEGELRSAVTAALAESSAWSDHPNYRGFVACEPRQFANGTVGPFQWQACPVVNSSGRQVFFWDWGSPAMLDGPAPFGIAYSPYGSPTVDPDDCVNELTAGWYEIWTPRGGGSGCPFGLSHL